ncbi:probable inactive shikimate kinase like 1, chloroplastic isoform X2 [Andrographis paniculata]|uniref:probable inactive shikimate kinase like 1, chloroplastic isoform X2 n=1 Tax=Andrographis paniculata TaxID=175694 RepID=UPI0021E810F8|nr:probable inactive shikimate kinase like 1, chloroplastic isoform X2 [Andrographis paniculata]
MEIIQTCVRGRCPAFFPLTPMLSSSGLSPVSTLLSLKPKASPPRRLFSNTCTRALLENNTSVATKAVELEDDDMSLTIKKRALEISSDLKGTSIFLVGINSSYKSSLGRILADALRYYYFDSDSLVEEAAGGKMSAIAFVEKDEEGYLASETEVLKQLSSMGRLVVCAGNGAVKSTTNLALLRHGISIWVDVPLDLVAREISEDRIQFSASDMPRCGSSSEVQAQVIALYNSAEGGYNTADVVVSLQSECADVASQLGRCDVETVSAEDLCLTVLKGIERLVRAKKMMEEAGRPF